MTEGNPRSGADEDLCRRVERLETMQSHITSDFYRDPNTGEPGVYHRVKRLDKFVHTAAILGVGVLIGLGILNAQSVLGSLSQFIGGF